MSAAGVVALRVDDAFVERSLDRLEKVLGNALMAQSALLNYYEDVIPKVQTPHVKRKLEHFRDRAARHREEAEELFAFIGRDPSRMKEAMGAAMTKVMEGMANVRGLGAGAYPDLQQLFVAELMSAGAFGTTAHVAIALGLTDVHEVALSAAKEKFGHWRYLQETLMENAPLAILDETPI